MWPRLLAGVGSTQVPGLTLESKAAVVIGKIWSMELEEGWDPHLIAWPGHQELRIACTLPRACISDLGSPAGATWLTEAPQWLDLDSEDCCAMQL